MKAYEPREKQKIVAEFKNSDQSANDRKNIANKYNIAIETLRVWVKRFNEKGSEGLKTNKRIASNQYIKDLEIKNKKLDRENKELKLSIAMWKEFNEESKKILKKRSYNS